MTDTVAAMWPAFRAELWTPSPRDPSRKCAYVKLDRERDDVGIEALIDSDVIIDGQLWRVTGVECFLIRPLHAGCRVTLEVRPSPESTNETSLWPKSRDITGHEVFGINPDNLRECDVLESTSEHQP